MENPHAERQNVLLQRIIKNVEKCTETFDELNHCLNEIVRANERVVIAAELVTKYRKNVQFNLDAMQESK
ncbi:DASH complex subunit Dad4 [Abortiporus biennis]|nr:DASH complex subunit Dad4 [Abortiporus biennis]